MSSDGKTVLCESYGIWPVAHTVSRALCAMNARPECGGCPNGKFVVRVQLRVVDQVVACPQWVSETERGERQDPSHYIGVRRETCLKAKPYPFCLDCPNGRAENLPRLHPKWFEEEERQRRIELQLDEEERDG